MVCWWAVAVCEKYLTPVTTTPNVSYPMDTALVPIVLRNEIVHHTNANLRNVTGFKRQLRLARRTGD